MGDYIYMVGAKAPVVNQLFFAVLIVNYRTVGDLKASFYKRSSADKTLIMGLNIVDGKHYRQMPY
jgi:hypothetical protein